MCINESGTEDLIRAVNDRRICWGGNACGDLLDLVAFNQHVGKNRLHTVDNIVNEDNSTFEQHFRRHIHATEYLGKLGCFWRMRMCEVAASNRRTSLLYSKAVLFRSSMLGSLPKHNHTCTGEWEEKEIPDLGDLPLFVSITLLEVRENESDHLSKPHSTGSEVDPVQHADHVLA